MCMFLEVLILIEMCKVLTSAKVSKERYNHNCFKCSDVMQRLLSYEPSCQYRGSYIICARTGRTAKSVTSTFSLERAGHCNSNAADVKTANQSVQNSISLKQHYVP